MKRIRMLSLLLAALLLLLPLTACGKRGTTLDDLPETDELLILLFLLFFGIAALRNGRSAH